MDQQRLHALDQVLGWFGYGLEYSPDELLKSPGRRELATEDSVLRSYPSERSGADAPAETPLQVLRVAVPAAAEIVRAETKHAVDLVAGRFPRVATRVIRETSGQQERDTTSVASMTQAPPPAPPDAVPPRPDRRHSTARPRFEVVVGRVADAIDVIEAKRDSLLNRGRSFRSTTKLNLEASLEVLGEAADSIAAQGDHLSDAVKAFGPKAARRVGTAHERLPDISDLVETPRQGMLFDQSATPAPTPAAELAEDVATVEDNAIGPVDAAAEPLGAPSWKERLLDFSERVSLRAGLGSKTPPSILSSPPESSTVSSRDRHPDVVDEHEAD